MLLGSTLLGVTISALGVVWSVLTWVMGSVQCVHNQFTNLTQLARNAKYVRKVLILLDIPRPHVPPARNLSLTV